MRRLSIVYLFAALLIKLPTYAQIDLDALVALNSTELTVQQLLQQLKETPSFRLAYSESHLDVDQPLQLSATTVTLRELLDALSLATHTTYQVRGGQIILRTRTGRATVSGYVRDSASGEDLIGANVWIQRAQQGTSTNNYGFYSLTVPTRTDSVTLMYSYVGYQPKTLRLALRQDTTVTVTLSDQGLLDEVVVRAEVEQIQEATQMSAVSVPIEQIKAAPALLGEVDVLKTLQLLPGVQSGNEGTSGLYVRGGGPDQNLILLDGVPVYNANHLFGFFSVFNADAINHVQLIKGGFPARYGGRLSSVVDISMKEGNIKELHGEGSLGLVAGKLTLEGPVVKDKASFIVSGRRTWIDLITRPIAQAQSNGNSEAGYYFYDLNAKMNYRFSNRDRLYLSAYLGSDRFYGRDKDGGNEQDIGLDWGNITSALRWNHTFGPKLFSNLALTYSRYQLRLFEESTRSVFPPGTFIPDGDSDSLRVSRRSVSRYVSGIEDIAAKWDIDYVPSPRHYLRFGASAIRHRFAPGALTLQLNNESDNTALDTLLGTPDNTYATEFALYAEDDIELTQNFKMNIGVHASGFSVNDKLYQSVQPRLAARYLLNPRLSVKASYARMTQFVHLLVNAGVGLPTDLWVPATERVRPQESQQVALGTARTWGNGYEVSLEGYYKTMDHVINYRQGTNFVGNNNNWQDNVVAGNGRAYGAELLVQKKEGRTTGWLGYTLSWSDRQFEELNFGERFPYKYDRRHDIGLAVQHQWRENIDLSLAWVFGTGNAVTLPQVRYAAPADRFLPDGILYNFGERNGYRVRAYHRLDASVSFKKSTRWGERAWVVGVYNAYSRQNPFFLQLEGNATPENPNRLRQYSLFPIIPSVSYQFKF